MRRGKRRVHQDDSRIRIALVILLAFFVANALGAMICNGVYGAKTSELGVELQTFFSGVRENGVAHANSFLSIYLKYLKYGLLIWIGGWLNYGMVISAVVLCFRGISLGFTTSMLLRTYGFKGIFAVFLTILPQNLILIPMYLCLTWAAVCFWLRRGRPLNAKAGLRREKHKQYIEYSVFLGGTLLLTAVAALIESFVIPVFMKSAALFLA